MKYVIGHGLLCALERVFAIKFGFGVTDLSQEVNKQGKESDSVATKERPKAYFLLYFFPCWLRFWGSFSPLFKHRLMGENKWMLLFIGMEKRLY